MSKAHEVVKIYKIVLVLKKSIMLIESFFFEVIIKLGYY